MQKRNLPIIIFAIYIFLSSSVYVVEQSKQTLVFQFGEVVRTVKDPGLHFKVPFIQNTIDFDKRILNVIAEDKEVIAKDQKRLIVNAYAKYKIIDPLKLYQTVRDEHGIRLRLSSIVDSALRQIIGEVPLSSLHTNERNVIMEKITERVTKQAFTFGIEVIDVRILRADLPKENSEAIYKRMQADREKEAKEFRAEGAEQAQKIKSKADKEAKIIVAEAQKQGEITRGEGEKIAAKNYADAFSKDPEFFGFIRTMQAYRNSLNSENTKLILSTDSKFLKMLNSMSDE